MTYHRFFISSVNLLCKMESKQEYNDACEKMTLTREGRERVKVQNVFCRRFCALTSFQDNLLQNSHSKLNLELPDLYLEALREVSFFCNFSKYNSKLKPMKNVWPSLSRHTSS